jgi:hypothetical protein
MAIMSSGLAAGKKPIITLLLQERGKNESWDSRWKNLIKLFFCRSAARMSPGLTAGKKPIDQYFCSNVVRMIQGLAAGKKAN